MAKDGGGSPHDLVVQSWIMYAIGMALYLLRLYACLLPTFTQSER